MNSQIVLQQIRVAVVFLLGCCLSTTGQSTKPLTFPGLVDALRMHGLTNAELAQIVKARGVDFQLTPERSSELKSAGADTPLLSAIAAAYRGAVNPPTAMKPQPQSQAQRSAAIQPQSKPVAATPSPAVSPQPAAASVAAAPLRAAVSSLRQVKNLYIERMPDGLDEYLKAELSRQIPGRFVVVLRPQDADAIVKGHSRYRDGTVSVTDLQGTIVLWTGQAGGSGIFHTGIRGGEKEIAKHLVSSLRKSLE